MQLAIAIGFAVVMISTAGIFIRSLAWSLDSPVLRRAWRKRRISRSTRWGFVAVVGIAALVLYRLGVRELSLAAVFFSTMLILFGSAAVMFCRMVVEDLREVFFQLADRFGMPAMLEKWDRPAREKLEQPDRRCVEVRRCTEEIRQPCGATGFSHPWRPVDRPRTGQHQ